MVPTGLDLQILVGLRITRGTRQAQPLRILGADGSGWGLHPQSEAALQPARGGAQTLSVAALRGLPALPVTEAGRHSRKQTHRERARGQVPRRKATAAQKKHQFAGTKLVAWSGEEKMCKSECVRQDPSFPTEGRK